MSAQHTPGPWTVGPGNDADESWIVQIAGGTRIAGIALRSSTEIELANARLIAAAPDLLALAKQVATECAECDGRGVHEIGTDCIGGEVIPVTEPCPDCADIRAVIDKAEGRS